MNRRLILHDWLRGFGLHVATGFIATAAHYGLMWLLLQIGMSPVPASAIGFLAGAITRFLLSYLHVFSPTVGVPTAMVRFIAAISLQLAANSAILAGFLALNWPVWIAQITTTVLLTASNYIIYRIWVFR